MSTKKTLVSGIKPTGRPHVGNYFGAMKQWVDFQDEYDSYIFIPDYHALTSVTDGELMRNYTLDVAIDLLTIGIDPDKVTLFKQSDVPEVTELSWIFNCLTTMPYLMRAHAFKDAEAKNKDLNVGTFGYPLLMAADILIQDADIVPVGQDQKQHVEYARDTAEKFNRLYDGDLSAGQAGTFRLPQAKIIEEVSVVPGIDGQKMSKSYGNTIPLFAEDDEIRKLAMSVVTDSKGVSEPKDPATDNVFALHKLFSTDDLRDIKHRYEEGTIGYKESKEILAENIIKFVTPLRERRKQIASDPEKIKQILKAGGEKARARAIEKMKDVRKKTGLD